MARKISCNCLVKSVDPGLGSDQTFIALLRNEAGSEIRKDLCRLGEQIL